MTKMRYREHDSLEVLKNPLYGRHVQAMTAEGLHSKAEIAEELAWRDMQIEALQAEVRKQVAGSGAVFDRETVDRAK